jgi:rSAM/selenodomain-associated transferase 2
MLFSIIMPCLNESDTLSASLTHLIETINDPSLVEIALCDGGSVDETLQLAREFPVSVLNAPKGRAHQMNTGAENTHGEWLVFLHTDTRLPSNWMRLIQQCPAPWGRFDVRLSGHHWFFRIIEKAMNLRSRLTSVSTGDQVLFFRRDFFKQLGGFPEIPLMEDIAMSKNARKVSSPGCIRHTVTTSSRRWEQNGIASTILLMWFMRLAYWMGMKPETLHRLYYS